MTTNNNAKTGNGRVPVIGPGVEHPVPIALNAAAWNGGQVYGDDGKMYWSDGVAWRKIPDAEEILGITQAPALVTVGTGGDFTTINDALFYLARFIPPGATFQEVNNRTEIRLMAGFVMDKPVICSNFDWSWCDITSVDAVVDVSVDYFDPLEYPGAADFNVAFLFVYYSPGPTIQTVFRLDYTWPGADTTIGPDAIIPIGLEVSRGASAAINGGGFQNFSRGVRSNGGILAIVDASIVDSRVRGADSLSAGAVNISHSRVDGIFATANGTISVLAGSGAVVGVAPSNCRRTTGSDSASDIVISNGGQIHVEATVLGGGSVPFNQNRRAGIIRKEGVPLLPAGIVAPESYTVATVPSAAAYPAHLIHVSNGDTGAPCLAVSNGTNWLRIALGAAVST